MPNLESPPTVSLLGAPGSYHDIVCDYFSPQSQEDRRLRCRSFLEIIERLENGEADRAVIAVANSEIGVLKDAYGVLAAHDSYVVGEVYLRVNHNLLVLPEVESTEEVVVVGSNAKALDQCHTYLSTHLGHAELREGQDTATCAQSVARLGDRSHAAIGSQKAAELYGLKVLAGSIQTNPDNQTRFWLIERQPREVNEADKTSLIVATANRPAALYEALGAWATRGIGLSSIQSRLRPHQIQSPWGAYLHASGAHEALDRIRKQNPGDPWDAHFDIDVEAGLQEPLMQEAMEDLAQQDGLELRVLGSYRQGVVIE